MAGDPRVLFEVQTIQDDLTFGLEHTLWSFRAGPNPGRPVAEHYLGIVTGLVPVVSAFYPVRIDFSPADFVLARAHAAQVRRLVGTGDPFSILDETYVALSALPGKDILIPDVLHPPRKS